MATIIELDPVFRQALRYLHSSQTDAAENIRKSLDEVIKQKHGSSKMLINTLSKKYIAEESKATGSGVIKSILSARRSSYKSTDSSSNDSPVQFITTTNITAPTATVLTTDLTGPVIISLPDSENGQTLTTADDNAMDTNIHSSLFEDLACVVCRRIDFVAKNRLIECTKCNSLYHQECHSPQINDSELANEQEAAWLCSECKGGSSAGTSVCSSSSSSSSKKEKEKEKEEKRSSSSSSKSKGSSSRHHSSSSSHHSSKHERSSGSGSDKGSSKSSSSAPHLKTKILSRSEKTKSSKSSRA